LNVAAALVLMGPLRHGGLALAASASAAANLAILLWLLWRRLGGLGGRRILWSLGRVAAATAVMAAWCGLLLWKWPPAATPALEAAWLVAAIGGAVGAYAAASLALRGEEGPALLALGRRVPGKLPSGAED
jgi:putative peptidoglycan lipid II flippase